MSVLAAIVASAIELLVVGARRLGLGVLPFAFFAFAVFAFSFLARTIIALRLFCSISTKINVSRSVTKNNMCFRL
jgi:hypothetical protein